MIQFLKARVNGLQDEIEKLSLGKKWKLTPGKKRHTYRHELSPEGARKLVEEIIGQFKQESKSKKRHFKDSFQKLWEMKAKFSEYNISMNLITILV